MKKENDQRHSGKELTTGNKTVIGKGAHPYKGAGQQFLYWHCKGYCDFFRVAHSLEACYSYFWGGNKPGQTKYDSPAFALNFFRNLFQLTRQYPVSDFPDKSNIPRPKMLTVIAKLVIAAGCAKWRDTSNQPDSGNESFGTESKSIQQTGLLLLKNVFINSTSNSIIKFHELHEQNAFRISVSN